MAEFARKNRSSCGQIPAYSGTVIDKPQASIMNTKATHNPAYATDALRWQAAQARDAAAGRTALVAEVCRLIEASDTAPSLDEPGVDFVGGEFVMTEHRPRMQSRPMVLPLNLGGVAFIGTAQRPFRGARDDDRVNLLHAISHVRGGERIGLELSFHDSPQREPAASIGDFPRCP